MLAVVIGMYVVVDSLSIRLSSASVLSYLGLIATATVLALGLLRRVRGVHLPLVLIAWSALMTLELLQLPWTLGIYRAKAVTDFVVMMTPLLVCLVLKLSGADRRDLLRAYLVIVYFSFVASMVGWSLSAGSRFDAPHILAITGAWILAASPSDALPFRRLRSLRATGWLMVVLLLPAIFASRSRTSLAVWLLSALFVIAAPRIRHAHRLVPVGLLIVLAGALVVDASSSLVVARHINLLIDQARLTQLVVSGSDISGEIRFREVLDVRDTMAREGGVMDRLLGFSHGASYIPQHSHVIANIDPVLRRVHNIHVTPVMIWFRYGVVGVIGFVLLLGKSIAMAARPVGQQRGALDYLQLLSLLMFLVALMFFNSTADPTFSWVLAAIFAASRPPVGAGAAPGSAWFVDRF